MVGALFCVAPNSKNEHKFQIFEDKLFRNKHDLLEDEGVYEIT